MMYSQVQNYDLNDVRAHKDETLHQRVTVRNMFTIYHIFKVMNLS